MGVGMRLALLLLLALASLALAPPAWAEDGDTLERIHGRGFLICGLRSGVSGISFSDPQGHLDGFLVDVCRVFAAATLGNAQAIRVVRLPEKPQEFQAVEKHEVDVALTTTTWTFSRELSHDIEFLMPLLHDGQGFAIHSDGTPPPPLDRLGVRTVCVKTATTTVRNLEDHIRKSDLPWTIRTFQTLDEALQAFLAHECDLLTTDRTVLVTSLAGYRQAGMGIYIYPDVISREPLTPYIARGDRNWYDITRWVLHAIVLADAKGVTSADVQTGRIPDDPELHRMLGHAGSVSRTLGLPDDWALQVLAQVGNYGEIFDRNLGTPYGMDRGQNKPWTQGGLLYAPPFR
ncbi:transporter substrate-binding domain-containing protein [Azospirillum melinis]|uniref:Transporter substrate-binding domain-containing protein n=1 Tax=Azospirillum melinis TaxID=328839 RepID=A0ABX2KJ09_9PROT|nr:amino acid ABC transporter substrate-binding protein [Azospirillum melinis]MBP2305583.1 general L-amino acid transport system substrate-binding protein [Azospirillum melinis]NUB03585.1 transporter substrate-binding domain-containing protein [Azospirillum melinis]